MNFVDAADIPLEQYEDDNEASGEDTQEDEENNEEPRRKRGKDRSYSQTHAFSNVDEFQGSEIYTELNQQMTRNNKSENKDYKIERRARWRSKGKGCAGWRWGWGWEA